MWSESIIEQTVQGLGYELVDVEWAGGGVLRVFIDNPNGDQPNVTLAGGMMAAGVTVDDCARVSEQLSRVFMVENVNYERLEISSPGLDRPLKKPADFVRFAGQEAQVKLRVSPTGHARGRKQFQGVLQSVGTADDVAVESRTSTPGRFGLVLEGDGGTQELLEFSFDEVEKARLVPRVGLKRDARDALSGAKGNARSNAGSKKR